MTGRILVLDAVPTNRIVLRVKLNAAFYEVAQAGTCEAAFKTMRKWRPDILIVSANMIDVLPKEFCLKLRTHPKLGRTPLIVVTSDNDPTTRLALLAAGADDVLERPFDDVILLARVRSLIRARDAETELQLREDTRRALGLAEPAASFAPMGEVALVSLSQRSSDDLHSALQDHGLARLHVVSPQEILRQRDINPDVIVLQEADGPSHEGLALLPQLRAHSATRRAKLIYIAQKSQCKAAATALDIGADDLLTHGADARELMLRVGKQLKRKHISDRLRADMQNGLRAAIVDPLTGLYNRRYALPHLQNIADQAEHHGRAYAVLLLDIDHFKSVNDRFGHSIGDKVLSGIAKTLRDNMRVADLIARIGGEEFLIVIPDSSRKDAKRTADRLGRIIAETPIQASAAQNVKVSVSIGVAISAPGQDVKTDALMNIADRALYAAKNKGRNLVILSDANETTPVPFAKGARCKRPAAPQQSIAVSGSRH